jgi:spermidine synthase
VATSPSSQSTTQNPADANSDLTIWHYYALFFTSGFPALLYQIVWQRALFTIYGVNIQSVTVIVTVFMIGLGIGSLAGGRLSTVRTVNSLRAFGCIEICIGIFGAFSLALFHSAARIAAGTSTLSTGAISFMLLLIPTLLMGSTLPLLVAFLVRTNENVGESVGSLYSVNTLGSAVACFLASMFLMRLLGETGCVRCAAIINLIVGGIAIFLSFSHARAPGSSVKPVAPAGSTPHSTIPMALGVVFAAVCGFIALAYEILWYHIYSFTSGTKASCFARLLGSYLIGIAYGALAVHDVCKRKFKDDLPRTIRGASIVVCLGTIGSFLVVPMTAWCVSALRMPYDLTFVFVSIGAALLGASFPILAHASMNPNEPAGKKLSYLYLANIIGSASGSFFIGFVAMDHITTAQVSLLLLFCGLLTAVVLAFLASPLPLKNVLIASIAACILLTLGSRVLFSSIFERLLMKSDYRSGTVFKNLVENRSGIIAVDASGFVWGGGAYDGQFKIDPVNDTNNIFRAFAIGALHPSPRHVLVIGLSSGSWAQVLVNHPSFIDATVVEINPGYLSLIQQRSVVSSLLNNPNVHIEIDDGRRWLVNHPAAKFDFILMNTTLNWRANVTNLLSVEFLQLARQHLKPGGILYYNTTSSERVQLTAVTVFPYALRVSNFIAVSDSPITFDRENWRHVLENYKIDGRKVFDLSNQAYRACIDSWVAMPQTDRENTTTSLDRSIEDRTSLMRRLRGQRLMTDDNMGTEWW